MKTSFESEYIAFLTYYHCQFEVFKTGLCNSQSQPFDFRVHDEAVLNCVMCSNAHNLEKFFFFSQSYAVLEKNATISNDQKVDE